ncbi:hypothetical protein DVH24_027463 [Malus domestica]|uniref:Uncharacterized protein n=1 Tax=Malus domestica TaxID=3750 RepID=A0A498HE62_MALDO|nr:hypothetical protein DVH24_027463 [Malus domestica]
MHRAVAASNPLQTFLDLINSTLSLLICSSLTVPSFVGHWTAFHSKLASSTPPESGSSAKNTQIWVDPFRRSPQTQKTPGLFPFTMASQSSSKPADLSLWRPRPMLPEPLEMWPMWKKSKLLWVVHYLI